MHDMHATCMHAAVTMTAAATTLSPAPHIQFVELIFYSIERQYKCKYPELYAFC